MDIPFDKISREQWLQQVAKELKTETPEEGLLYELEDLTVSASPSRDKDQSQALRSLFDRCSSNWDVLVPQSENLSNEDLLNLGATHVLDSSGLHTSDTSQFDIDTRTFSDTSLHTSQRLAIALLSASNALRTGDYGTINVLLSLSPHFYMNIASLRTFRWLFMQVARHYNAHPKLYLHAVVNNNNELSAEDALIGYTCQAVSAIAGKADGVQIPRFKDEDTTSGYRLSINIFNLLRVESLLDQHAEAASGSWFIDGVTSALIEKTWKWFLAMNTNEGDAILSGDLTKLNELHVD